MTDAVKAAREAVIVTNTFPTDPVFLHTLSLYEAEVRADERSNVRARIHNLIGHDSSMIRAGDVLAALDDISYEPSEAEVERAVIQRDCTDYGHTDHYEVPGLCTNCWARYTLRIPMKHEAPGSMLGWGCPACGCDRVGTDGAPYEPGEAEVEGAVKAMRKTPFWGDMNEVMDGGWHNIARAALKAAWGRET